MGPRQSAGVKSMSRSPEIQSPSQGDCQWDLCPTQLNKLQNARTQTSNHDVIKWKQLTKTFSIQFNDDRIYYILTYVLAVLVTFSACRFHIMFNWRFWFTNVLNASNAVFLAYNILVMALHTTIPGHNPNPGSWLIQSSNHPCPGRFYVTASPTQPSLHLLYWFGIDSFSDKVNMDHF